MYMLLRFFAREDMLSARTAVSSHLILVRLAHIYDVNTPWNDAESKRSGANPLTAFAAIQLLTASSPMQSFHGCTFQTAIVNVLWKNAHKAKLLLCHGWKLWTLSSCATSSPLGSCYKPLASVAWIQCRQMLNHMNPKKRNCHPNQAVRPKKFGDRRRFGANSLLYCTYTVRAPSKSKRVASLPIPLWAVWVAVQWCRYQESGIADSDLVHPPFWVASQCGIRLWYISAVTGCSSNAGWFEPLNRYIHDKSKVMALAKGHRSEEFSYSFGQEYLILKGSKYYFRCILQAARAGILQCSINYI